MEYESYEARKVVSSNKNTEQKWRPQKIKHTLISLDDRLFILLNGLLARQKMGKGASIVLAEDPFKMDRPPVDQFRDCGGAKNMCKWVRLHDEWVRLHGGGAEVRSGTVFHSNRGAFIVVVVVVVLVLVVVLVEKWTFDQSIEFEVFRWRLAGLQASQASPQNLNCLRRRRCAHGDDVGTRVFSTVSVLVHRVLMRVFKQNHDQLPHFFYHEGRFARNRPCAWFC